MARFEVREKYVIGGKYNDDYLETLANLKLNPPDENYGYRRTMPLLEEIERPIEIPGNNKECILRFFNGEDMTVLENYDDLCIRLHDMEEEMLMQNELLIAEISKNYDEET